MQTFNIKCADMAQMAEATARRVAELNVIASKEVLTSEETARYLGVSLSYLYKLTMTRAIPFYKPSGKLCYFNREEIEKWLQRNRVATDEELTRQANDYCQKGGRK